MEKHLQLHSLRYQVLCFISGSLCHFPVVPCAGPTRRFRRVCEKLQAAIVNPSSVNRMSMELVDFGDNGHSNPSLSSDDTLATSTASPVLEDPSTGTAVNGSQEEISKSRILAGGYESTEDECESEDGLHTEMLLQADVGN